MVMHPPGKLADNNAKRIFNLKGRAGETGEMMRRLIKQPNFVAGFQQTMAMMQQVQGQGTCWRQLSERIGYLVRANLPWSNLAPFPFPMDELHFTNTLKRRK